MLQVNEREWGASQTGGFNIDRMPVGKSFPFLRVHSSCCGTFFHLLLLLYTIINYYKGTAVSGWKTNSLEHYRNGDSLTLLFFVSAATITGSCHTLCWRISSRKMRKCVKGLFQASLHIKATSLLRSSEKHTSHCDILPSKGHWCTLHYMSSLYAILPSSNAM